MADSDWKRLFEDPIPLPRGRQLVALKDAADYILKLPKAEHQAPEWQAAMEALILVATPGPTTSGYRISRRGSCAQLAASAAPTCGRVSTGMSRDRSAAWVTAKALFPQEPS